MAAPAHRTTLALARRPPRVFTLRAALTDRRDLIDPTLNIPDLKLVQLLLAQVRLDVQARETGTLALVASRDMTKLRTPSTERTHQPLQKTWSELVPNNLLPPETMLLKRRQRSTYQIGD